MKDQNSKLKVIKIMDPMLCVRCDHAYVADVMLSSGKRKKMFYCARLDCDNWLLNGTNEEAATGTLTLEQ